MTTQKNVGWVRPEAVTHQTETIRVASLGDVTVPKIDQGGPVGSGEFVYVDISSVDNKLKRITEQKALAVAAAPSRAKQRLKAGDVLVSMTRPNLNAVAMVPQELDNAIGSTGFHVLRATEDTEPRWLYYVVQTHGFISAMSELVQGALYPAVRPKDIRVFEIPHPPLDHQKRIVAEIEKQFSRLDEAVANLKRVKANLKRYKAAVLKAAVEGRLVEIEAELARKKTPSPLAGDDGMDAGGRVTQGAVTEGRGEGASYETGAQLLQRILEARRSQWKGKGKYKEPAAPDTTDLPELPEGWVWASVEQMADVGTGATPLRSKREYYDNGKIPWVTSGALNEEFVSAADEYITDLAVQATNAKVFPTHTLLVAMYGEGKTRGKVSELLIEAATNQACAAIVMEGLSAKVRDYIKLFFLKNYEDIRRLSSGGVQPNLNLSHIKATAIPLAPLAEQNRIVAEVDRRLSLVREVEIQVDANLKRAERLHQSILALAFSGKLSTQDLRLRSIDAGELPFAMAAESSPTYSHIKQ